MQAENNKKVEVSQQEIKQKQGYQGNLGVVQVKIKEAVCSYYLEDFHFLASHNHA